MLPWPASAGLFSLLFSPNHTTSHTGAASIAKHSFTWRKRFFARAYSDEGKDTLLSSARRPMACTALEVLSEEVCESSSGSPSRPAEILSAAHDKPKCIPSGRDEDAMRLVQNGDAEAMSHLFNRYSRPVLSLAMRILRNRAEAQEVLQDVFLYIHRKSALFDPGRGTVASWVLQVAYSKSLNRRKRVYAAPSSSPVPISVADRLPHPDMDPQRVVEQLSAGKLMQLALAHLPEHQRETLWLYFSDGYSLREISRRRKERLGNTRHHFYRGIKNLRRAIVANEQTAHSDGDNQRTILATRKMSLIHNLT